MCVQAFDLVFSEKIKSSIKTGIFGFINIDVLSLFVFILCVGNVKQRRKHLNTLSALFKPILFSSNTCLPLWSHYRAEHAQNGNKVGRNVGAKKKS